MDQIVESLNLILDELPDDGCRWPYGESSFVFCGHPAVEGKPYCAGHCRIAYQQVREANRIERPHYAAVIRKRNQAAVMVLMKEHAEESAA